MQRLLGQGSGLLLASANPPRQLVHVFQCPDAHRPSVRGLEAGAAMAVARRVGVCDSSRNDHLGNLCRWRLEMAMDNRDMQPVVVAILPVVPAVASDPVAGHGRRKVAVADRMYLPPYVDGHLGLTEDACAGTPHEQGQMLALGKTLA